MTRVIPVRSRPTVELAVLPGAAASQASADDAETSAASAAASASTAAGSASAAAASATAAQTAETNAETAEANAETAEANAETAQGLAEAARDAALAAQTAAEVAEGNAETAATTATTQAGIATTQAGLASTSATNAQTAETNAETAETNAEAAQVAAENARDTALSTYANLDGGTTNQVLIKASNTDFDFGWQTFASMSAATYDPQNISADAFDTDNHTSGTTNKVYTATEQTKLGHISVTQAVDLDAMETKLAGIESAADVTDAANVAAAGAVMNTRQVISGAGLTGGGDLSADRTLAVGAGTGILSNADDVAVDKATDANVRAAASNKVITSDLLESASALVTLTDAATVAVDWDAGINFALTITANRILGNPTNGQPGTWRTVHVQANNTTDRTLTFGNQYLNDLPTLTDIDSAQEYLLVIYCLTTTHFIVTATKATDW